MNIYTKTGDDGTTGLLGAGRVRKDDLRIEAYGTVDELNAVVGLARSHGLDAEVDRDLERVQNDLFVVGSALADPSEAGKFRNAVTPDHAERLEALIDAAQAELPELTRFILPGGSPGASTLHLARTVCRRAERLVVRLAAEEPGHVSPHVLTYLNRLSDALFVVARLVNQHEGVDDVPWDGL